MCEEDGSRSGCCCSDDKCGRRGPGTGWCQKLLLVPQTRSRPSSTHPVLLLPDSHIVAPAATRCCMLGTASARCYSSFCDPVNWLCTRCNQAGKLKPVSANQWKQDWTDPRLIELELAVKGIGKARRRAIADQAETLLVHQEVRMALGRAASLYYGAPGDSVTERCDWDLWCVAGIRSAGTMQDFP